MNSPKTVLAQLGPMAQLRAGRLPRRLTQLVVGLLIYGMSMAMMVLANLGAMPWDVFHLGMTQHLPISFGTAVILASVAVLLLWIPLRQAPGLGTILNAVLIGLAADLTLAFVPAPDSMAMRIGFLLIGVTINGLATALYIGAQLGPGPRDGLMTGLSRVTGRSIRLVRTGLEVSVIVIGWMLGGTVGVGTVLYALAIGPIVQAVLPWTIVTLPQTNTAMHKQKPASSFTAQSRE